MINEEGKIVCDECQENRPEYSSGGTELCYPCADGVGWIDVLNDQY